jgi:hypothetical protein
MATSNLNCTGERRSHTVSGNRIRQDHPRNHRNPTGYRTHARPMHLHGGGPAVTPRLFQRPHGNSRFAAPHRL